MDAACPADPWPWDSGTGCSDGVRMVPPPPLLGASDREGDGAAEAVADARRVTPPVAISSPPPPPPEGAKDIQHQTWDKCNTQGDEVRDVICRREVSEGPDWPWQKVGVSTRGADRALCAVVEVDSAGLVFKDGAASKLEPEADEAVKSSQVSLGLSLLPAHYRTPGRGLHQGLWPTMLS